MEAISESIMSYQEFLKKTWDRARREQKKNKGNGFAGVLEVQVREMAREYGITAETFNAWRNDVMEEAQGTMNELSRLKDLMDKQPGPVKNTGKYSGGLIWLNELSPSEARGYSRENYIKDLGKLASLNFINGSKGIEQRLEPSLLPSARAQLIRDRKLTPEDGRKWLALCLVEKAEDMERADLEIIADTDPLWQEEQANYRAIIAIYDETLVDLEELHKFGDDFLTTEDLEKAGMPF